MRPDFSAERLEQVLGAITERFGIVIDSRNHDMVVEILRERLAASRLPDLASYAGRLRTAEGHEEARALAERVTVGETYFYRHPEQFKAFAEVALPGRLAARRGVRRLELLSVGSSSGEEAYTLAMLVRQHAPDLASWTIRIRGIDVNPAAIRKARLGVYTAWSLRDTPAGEVEAWFSKRGSQYYLDDSIRRMATFEERNLLDDDPGFWIPESLDVVFFRNVLIYFSPDSARQAIARLSRSLAPGGYLFLGSAETLRGISQDFRLLHSHETFYYRWRVAGETPGAEVALAGGGAAAPAFGPPPASARTDTGAVDDAWFHEIRRSTDRIAALSEPPSATAKAAAAEPRREAAADLSAALESFRAERFADALAHIEGMPVQAAADADARLLHAAVLCNLGRLADAERLCKQLLAADEQNAGAHYLKAVCHEQAKDPDAARKHLEMAVFLDPRFALAHLHLGRLVKRRGDFSAARRLLSEALSLVAIEDPSRLLLFGGGFGRDALAEVCRNEIASCEGRGGRKR